VSTQLHQKTGLLHSNSREIKEEVDRRRRRRQEEVDRHTYSDDLVDCTLQVHSIAADRNVGYYSNICVTNNFGTHPLRLIVIINSGVLTKYNQRLHHY
jgi:hypothetical protein